MKHFLHSVLVAVCAILLFSSCEPMDKTGDPTGNLWGSWRCETMTVDIRTTVNGNTNTTTNTTDYSKDYVYLLLGEKFLATGFYNAEMEMAAYSYDPDKGTIRFSDGISVSDHGKAMILVGTYQVELSKTKLVLRQTFGIEKANEQTTYTFRREERQE